MFFLLPALHLDAASRLFSPRDLEANISAGLTTLDLIVDHPEQLSDYDTSFRYNVNAWRNHVMFLTFYIETMAEVAHRFGKNELQDYIDWAATEPSQSMERPAWSLMSIYHDAHLGYLLYGDPDAYSSVEGIEPHWFPFPGMVLNGVAQA